MAVRGVLFDLDGTIADTLRTIAAALNDGLRALGLTEHAEDAVAGMVGEGVRVLCRKALAESDRDRLEDLLPAVRLAYEREPMRHCRLYPGMSDLLSLLTHRSARLGVLSNKPHDLTCKTVEGLGIAELFPVVLGHRDEFPHKPDPTSARHVLAELGLTPEETLYVGDTRIDMETAAATGMRSVAVTWGFRGRDELQACGPAYLVDHPSEIGAIYDALSRE